MNPIDKFLNNITMYRLVVYVLGILSALSVMFAFMGRLSASPTALVASLVLLIVAAYVTDRGLGRWFDVPTNMESSLITALILFLILQPVTSLRTGLVLVLAGALASASKFIFAWRGRHIFNPAALAAATLSLTSLSATTWWVGSTVLWPFTLILGLAVVRKIRRFPLFLTFIIVSVAVQAAVFAHAQQPLGVGMKHALIASPLLFLGTIMLTEPATMPPRRGQQIVFAALVAVLYVTAWQFGPLIVYPEVALLLGNVFAYLVSPKFRVRLRLAAINRVSDRVYDYVFHPDRPFRFRPGQYMEWTLAGVPYDSRGNRRTFTIASSPTEQEVHLGLKYYEPASAFKAVFYTLKPGDIVYGSQLAGDFTLDGNEHHKLALIAGGIGITPFRSMVKYLTDEHIQSDVVLLYAVGDPREFAYADELKTAAEVGVKVVPIVTDPAYHAQGVVTGQLDAELLSRLVPDYAQRMFYLSGPNAMVDTTKKHLHALGVTTQHIRTDHFSGY